MGLGKSNESSIWELFQYSNTPTHHYSKFQGVQMAHEWVGFDSGDESDYSELSSSITFWLPPLFLAR
jgi:hypothetical protein